MRKRIPSSYQNCVKVSSDRAATSRRGQKYIHRCDRARFIHSANTGQVLSKPSVGPEEERKGPHDREGRKDLPNVYSLILFMSDLILYPQKSGHNFHVIHNDTKSQRSCFS